MVGDGFNGPESVAFPNLWASMFGIKMDGDALGLENTGNLTGLGSGYAPGTPLGFGMPLSMTGGAFGGMLSAETQGMGDHISLGDVGPTGQGQAAVGGGGFGKRI